MKTATATEAFCKACRKGVKLPHLCPTTKIEWVKVYKGAALLFLLVFAVPAHAVTLESTVSATLVETVTIKEDGTVDGQQPVSCEMIDNTYMCNY